MKETLINALGTIICLAVAIYARHNSAHAATALFGIATALFAVATTISAYATYRKGRKK